MNETVSQGNIDPKVVEAFGREWAAFDQSALAGDEYAGLFDSYFEIFPFGELPADAEGFDLGCGSGRWAAGVLPRVGTLHCIDPSADALNVAKRRLGGAPNARFHLASADAIPLPDNSQDFGYSLGVLHHIPDTEAAMRDCVRKLKLGAPFLVYLYYRFDNKPAWFAGLWQVSEIFRKGICRLPFGPRKAISSVIAAAVYWPLARVSRIAAKAGFDVAKFPLSPYGQLSFYTMRTDALDRFGTRLEHRYTRDEIEMMMTRCGLTGVHFHEGVPFWVACGYKTD